MLSIEEATSLFNAREEAKRERERADFFAQLAGQRFSEPEPVDHRRKFWCKRFDVEWVSLAGVIPKDRAATCGRLADSALEEYDKRWSQPLDAPKEKP
jgi:hypothetical protein